MEKWEMTGMFNPFPFIDEYFNSKLEKVSDMDENEGNRGK